MISNNHQISTGDLLGLGCDAVWWTLYGEGSICSRLEGIGKASENSCKGECQEHIDQVVQRKGKYLGSF